MDSTPNREPKGSPEHPDVCVDHADTVTVLHALGKLVATKRITYNKPTQTYQTREYDNLKTFRITEHSVSDILSLTALLDHIATNPQACVVRGKPAAGINRKRAVRRLHPRLNTKTGEIEPATLLPADRRWLLLDIDGIDCPPGIDPLYEPDAAVEHVVSLLPADLHGVTCRWAFTSGHWIRRQDSIRLRLAFWLDRAVSAEYLEAWLAGYPVDTAVFRPAQINYIAHPIFEGVADPVPYRSGLWRGDSDTVELPEIDLSRPTVSYAAAPGTPGLGYEGHRADIGDHDGGKGFNAPLLSAIGAFFRRHGACVDAEWLIADLAEVIRERGTRRGDAYIERRIRDLDGMIAHTRAREAAREAEEATRAPFVPAPEIEKFERCEPSFTLPIATIEEAGTDLMEAMEKVFRDYLPDFMTARRQYQIDKAIAEVAGTVEPIAPLPRQIGIAADMAAGKTRAAIALALAAIARQPDIRILYAVPNHTTGEDIVSRINKAAGREIARRWAGLDRPDPEHDGKFMCWRNKEVKVSTGAGGTTSSVCGSRNRGYCPFHEKGADDGVCGVRRQALAAVADQYIRVWIVPHAMINKVLPPALQRQKLKASASGQEVEVPVDAFDFFLLDEQPWLSMFGGVGETHYSMPLDDLMRDLCGFWEVPARTGDTVNGTSRLAFLMTTAHSLLSDNADGWVVRGKLRPGRVELTAVMCREARALTYRLMWDVDEVIDPKDVGGTEDALKDIADHNRAVLKLARLWSLLEMVTELESDTDRSPYLRLVNKGGRRHIVMAWKDTIHDSLMAVPILYLDGTMNATIASPWLERLDVVADIKAKTPDSVYRRQIADRAVCHTMIAPSEKLKKLSAKNQKTAENNVVKLAHVLELRASQFKGQGKPNAKGEVIDCAAIMPMATRLAMESGFGAGNPLTTVPLEHQNNVRGSDRYSGVRSGSVIGRILPAPAVPELYAWLATGKVGECIPKKEFYPVREAGLLMRDGTGRKVSQRYHPDPMAEAWRWQICEGELLQDEARWRAKRRNDDSPLLVEIVTNVPLPLEIDEVITMDEYLAEAHALAMMVARQAVFEDHDGIGRACADMFRGGSALPNAVKQYFKRHPEIADKHKAFMAENVGYERYKYRPIGRRNSGHVLVHASVADPKAHVEKFVGQCDVWSPAPVGSASVADAADDAEEMMPTQPAPAEEIHDPAAYEPEELAAIGQDTAAPVMISLDTVEGIESFKRALNQASIANAAARAAARRETLTVWEPEDVADLEPLVVDDEAEEDAMKNLWLAKSPHGSATSGLVK